MTFHEIGQAVFKSLGIAVGSVAVLLFCVFLIFMAMELGTEIKNGSTGAFLFLIGFVVFSGCMVYFLAF